MKNLKGYTAIVDVRTEQLSGKAVLIRKIGFFSTVCLIMVTVLNHNSIKHKLFSMNGPISAVQQLREVSSCTGPGPGCSCTNSANTGSNCPRDGSGYSYKETLSATTRSITISGCPNHAFYDNTPNTAVKGSFTMIVPLLPSYISSSETDGSSLTAAGSK